MALISAEHNSSEQCQTGRVFRYLMNISDEFLSNYSCFPRNIKNYGQIKNLGQIFSFSLNHTEINTRPGYQSVKPKNIKVWMKGRQTKLNQTFHWRNVASYFCCNTSWSDVQVHSWMNMIIHRLEYSFNTESDLWLLVPTEALAFTFTI